MNEDELSSGVALIADHLEKIVRALDTGKRSSDFEYLQRRLTKLDSPVAKRLSEAMAMLADDKDKREADENWQQVIMAFSEPLGTSRPCLLSRFFG